MLFLIFLFFNFKGNENGIKYLHSLEVGVIVIVVVVVVLVIVVLVVVVVEVVAVVVVVVVVVEVVVVVVVVVVVIMLVGFGVVLGRGVALGGEEVEGIPGKEIK